MSGCYCDLATLEYYVTRDRRDRAARPLGAAGRPLPFRLYYYVDTPDVRCVCPDNYGACCDDDSPVCTGAFPVRLDPEDPASRVLDPLNGEDLERWPRSLPVPTVMSRERREWIVDTLNGMAEGQAAVIISRQPGSECGGPVPPEDAAMVRGASEGDPDETLEALPDPYAGRIACLPAGHVHRDRSYVSKKGLLTVTTAADGMWPGEDGCARGANTVGGGCFDVFGIDTARRLITAARVGPCLTHDGEDPNRVPWVGQEGVWQWTYTAD